MKINTKELQSRLGEINTGLNTKGLIEQMGHYMFTGTHIITFNDTICMTTPFETDFQCSVPADKLLKVVKACGKDTDISLNDNVLIIISGKLKANLITYAEDQLSLKIKSIMEEMDKWNPIPKDMLVGMQLCSFAASTDDYDKSLTFVSVEDHIIRCASRIRASRYRMESKSESFMINADTIKYIKNATDIQVGNTWVHLLYPSMTTMSIRKREGEYPIESIDKGLDMTTSDEVELPENIIKLIDKVSILAPNDKDDRSMLMLFNNNELNCSIQTEMGTIEDSLSIEFDKSRTILINPYYLKEIVQHCDIMEFGENMVYFSICDKFKHGLALKED